MENLRSEIYKEINPEFGAGPDVSVSAIGNIYTRMMRFNSKGTKELGHSHTFDHMTILASGKLKVTVDEKETEFKAPAMIYIKAGKVHELEAMEDKTLAFCVHALRKADDYTDIIDPSQLPEGVSLTDTINHSFPMDFDLISEIISNNPDYMRNEKESKESGIRK
jgi:mannose-6-phosphate isomerase-like protein (cupin superfamily)